MDQTYQEKIKIKELPEDFLVNENSSVAIKERGAYLIALLKKKNYTTERAVQQIADALCIDRKRIGYAGNKDSKAITEQSISIERISKEKAEALQFKDIELKFLGYSDEPISLGDLFGNSFEIVVRNITNRRKPKKISKIINYFGEQRFSTNNAEIGKAIIKKGHKHAVDLILKSIGSDEKKVIQHLEENKNDFVGALKRMPWKTLNMYIHAYQSKLWNETARRLMHRDDIGKKNSPAPNGDAIKIPLVGFSTEIEDDRIRGIVDSILKEESVALQDFVIRAIPDLSSAGNERELFTEVKDLKIGELEDDELNQGKKKVKVAFSLGKGSYATEVIKEMFS